MKINFQSLKTRKSTVSGKKICINKIQPCPSGQAGSSQEPTSWVTKIDGCSDLRFAIKEVYLNLRTVELFCKITATLF